MGHHDEMRVCGHCGSELQPEERCELHPDAPLGSVLRGEVQYQEAWAQARLAYVPAEKVLADTDLLPKGSSARKQYIREELPPAHEAAAKVLDWAARVAVNEEQRQLAQRAANNHRRRAAKARAGRLAA